MQPENVHEYDLVRTEMRDLRNCITNYVGFVLGGSGLALFGLGTGENITPLALAYVPVVLSVVSVLVLFVLFYKFNSHNRYAGYCRVLTSEHWVDKKSEQEECFAWEYCIKKLKDCDLDPSVMVTLCDSILTLSEEARTRFRARIMPLVGKDPQVDSNKTKKGWSLIRRLLVWRAGTSSWSFPIWLVLVFVVLNCVWFLNSAIGIYLVVKKVFMNQDISISGAVETLVVVTLLLLAAVFHLYVWRYLAGKLFTLLDGSATVNAFALRFVPIRMELSSASWNQGRLR